MILPAGAVVRSRNLGQPLFGSPIMCPPRFSNNGKRRQLPELEARSVPGQHRPQLRGRAVVRGVLLELHELLHPVLR